MYFILSSGVGWIWEELLENSLIQFCLEKFSKSDPSAKA